MSERHKIVVKVYFAEQARHADIEYCEETARRLNQLKKVDDVYLASTRDDFEKLRPYEIK